MPAQQPSSGLTFNRRNRPTFQPALTAFGRGDVAVAHHPLNLVDLELADRLRPEGMAQLVEAEPRQARSLARIDETSVEVGGDDRLAWTRATLKDQCVSGHCSPHT
jgi:hypothetical protein